LGCANEFYNRFVLGSERYIHRGPTLAIKGETVNAPIKEGRQILARVMSALVDAPECYIPVRGPWMPLTDAQTANWEARQTISKLLREGTAELDAIVDAIPLDLPLNDKEVETLDTLRGIEAKQAQLFS
jgi:hypothetical protein